MVSKPCWRRCSSKRSANGFCKLKNIATALDFVLAITIKYTEDKIQEPLSSLCFQCQL